MTRNETFLLRAPLCTWLFTQKSIWQKIRKWGLRYILTGGMFSQMASSLFLKFCTLFHLPELFCLNSFSQIKKKSLRILWYFNAYFSVHLTHFPKHRIFKHQSWHKGKEILSGFVGSSTLGLGALPSAFPVPISPSQSYSSTSTTLPRATAAEEVSPPLMASSAAEHRRFSCPLEKRRYSCAPVTAGGTSKWSGKQGQEKKPLFVDGGEYNDN